MTRVSSLAVIACMMLTVAATGGADKPSEPVIFDMDAVRHLPTEITTEDQRKISCGAAESVDGKFGKAVRFSFVENARGGFMAAGVGATAGWDAAEGFSFWVEGDGSDAWGGLELIDRDDFGNRYGYCFPIDSTEWRKITVRWRDLTPELASPLVDAKQGYAPSKFGNFWFGKWQYWREYPAHSYAIDHVALEQTIPDDPQPANAAPPPPDGSLRRFRDKLAAGTPVTVVTMGDSLSDERHWANRETLWSKLLAADLKAKHGVDVRLVNPALGGTTLSQNLVLMPRWLKDTPAPDLVIVWFGYNDWDAGVRGERFAEYLRVAVERIRRATGGGADVLLLTTAPAHDRWETAAELEEAARTVAKETGAALVDVAAEFRRAGSPEAALEQGYWVGDKVHLGPKGHEVVKDLIHGQIEATK